MTAAVLAEGVLPLQRRADTQSISLCTCIISAGEGRFEQLPRRSEKAATNVKTKLLLHYNTHKPGHSLLDSTAGKHTEDGS